MDMRVGGYVRGATEFPVGEFRIRLDFDNFTHAQQSRNDFECLRDRDNGVVLTSTYDLKGLGDKCTTTFNLQRNNGQLPKLSQSPQT